MHSVTYLSIAEQAINDIVIQQGELFASTKIEELTLKTSALQIRYRG